MDITYAIPLAALIVSLATLVFAAISLKKKASNGWVQRVEDRLAAELRECRENLKQCHEENRAHERRIDELNGVNMSLLKELLGPGRPVP